MGLVSNIVKYHLLILQTSNKKTKSHNLLQDFNVFTDIIPVLYPDAPRMGLYVLGRNEMPYILFKTDNHELDKPAPTVHGRRLRSGLSDTWLCYGLSWSPSQTALCCTYLPPPAFCKSLRLFSLTFYLQASVHINKEGGVCGSKMHTPSTDKMKEKPCFSGLLQFGGRNRTRTCDPIDVNDVLYPCVQCT